MSFVSVVFVFNNSFNDVAPASSTLFTVVLKNGLLMHVIVCCLFCFGRPRLSFVIVVFDFNASHNNVAPAFPIMLSIYLIRIGKKKKVAI